MSNEVMHSKEAEYESLMFIDSPTDVYRTIIEVTPMHHNNMFVVYSNFPFNVKNKEKYQALFDKMERSFYCKPKIMVTRPIYDFEINLIAKGVIKYEKEDISPKSKYMDALFEMRQDIIFNKVFLNNNASKVIAHSLGTNFYDCMSGGMSKESCDLHIFICKHSPNVNKDEYVYPSSEKGKEHYDINDFLKQTDKDDRENEFINFIDTHVGILKMLEC